MSLIKVKRQYGIRETYINLDRISVIYQNKQDWIVVVDGIEYDVTEGCTRELLIKIGYTDYKD